MLTASNMHVIVVLDFILGPQPLIRLEATTAEATVHYESRLPPSSLFLHFSQCISPDTFGTLNSPSIQNTALSSDLEFGLKSPPSRLDPAEHQSRIQCSAELALKPSRDHPAIGLRPCG